MAADREVLAPDAGRVAHLDALKVLLVAGIIAGHGALGYSDLDGAWPYQDVQEVTLHQGVNIGLVAVALPVALFAMGLFFLISGLVTPPSLDRKGPRRFARDRLVRLGIPFVIWVLVIWPALIFAVHRAAGEHRSYLEQFKQADPFLDTGPMWFVEVLLIYSLVYAAWRARRGADDGDLDRGPLTARTVVALAGAVSLATVLVRMVFPIGSFQPVHPNLWQWPQYIAMFGLGIVAARRGWLSPVPREVVRRSRSLAVAGLAGFVLLCLAMAASGVDGDVLFHERLHWAPLTLAALEGPLAVGFCLWLLAGAQARFARPLGPLGQALARSAFAAFLLQGAILLGLALALRPVGLPAEVKALTVALAGTILTFALAWVLVTRTALGRVL